MDSQLLRRVQAFEDSFLPVFRDLCAFVRDSCVRGLPPIFGSLNIGAHRGFSRKTAHNAITEEVQEECSH
jgi:hypothetical protein